MKNLKNFMSLIILFVLTGLSYAYAQDSGKRRITGTH